MTLVLLGTILLTSCGQDEPPACSDKQVESKIRDLVLQGTLHAYALPHGSDLTAGILPVETAIVLPRSASPNGVQIRIESVFQISIDKFLGLVHMTFSDERDRHYDDSIKKRYCVSAIRESLDSRFSDAILSVKHTKIVSQNVPEDASASDIMAGKWAPTQTPLDDRDLTDAQRNEVLTQLNQPLQFIASGSWSQNYSVQKLKTGASYIALDE